MKTAIVYTRYSPRRNAKDSESAATQEAQCREYAKARNWPVKSAHGDKALSGKEVYKPGLEAAIQALRPGDVLLVYSRCRIARKLMLSLFVEEKVKGKGARIVAVTGDPVGGDGPEAVMLRQIIGAVHEYERKLIAARTKAAMLTKQQAGRKISRHLPFGYETDPKDKTRFVKCEAEQRALKRAKALRAKGATWYGITKTLNEEHPGTSRGAKFNANTVKKFVERKL